MNSHPFSLTPFLSDSDWILIKTVNTVAAFIVNAFTSQCVWQCYDQNP